MKRYGRLTDDAASARQETGLMQKIKIGIIIGSIRENSQSGRIGDYVAELLHQMSDGIEPMIFSLRDIELPFWTEDKWKADSEMSAFWKPHSQALKACHGFVVIAPEWAGMAPPHLKNFLLMCDKGELAHKPAQLIAVSTGMGGAYPIAELRMSGYKNNFLWWLPDHVILRQVAGLFASEKPTELDTALTDRLLYGLAFLVETAKVVAPVREKLQNITLYKNGM
ncbi:MAG: NADPH-dependent oxidoreductase [Alphaproteobacteria bacterium]|nr:MAG: NADPH-dependent oxidoreductase [Alphaproteobacteria bacterium]